MSTYRKIPLTVNIDTGYIIDPLDGARISNEKLPAFCYGETAILCLSFVDSDLNTFSFNSDDLFEFAMDSDFVHETDGAEDPLMAYSANDMVDISGDWASISRSDGNISIRIDCFTEGFLAKIDTDEEMDVWFEVKRYISGSSYPSEILRDKCYARNVLKTTEGAPASADPEYYNAVQVDSLLSVKADTDHTHDTYLLKASNLSDLPDVSTARTSLGLGGSATLDVGTASGTVSAGDHTHDAYLAKASDLSDLSDASAARDNLGLGDGAVLDVGSSSGTLSAGDHTHDVYLAKASDLSDLSDASTARTNLGLGGSATLDVGTAAGTVAAGDDSRITGAAQVSSNLSDLSDASTARTNLGLGDSAILDVGTSTGTVAAGDHAHAFTGLTDAPSTYSGQAGKYAVVNSTEDGLQFSTPAGGGDVTGPSSSTSGNIPSFADATGKDLQDSGVGISTVSAHISNTSNPHSVTASQVGLGNVSNVDQTNASNISSGTLDAARLPSSGVSAGTYTNAALTVDSYGRITDAGSGLVINQICNGRLTLSTGVPVPTSDVTAATTLYFTPYNGNMIALYYSSVWLVTSFSETSLDISSLTASTNYDIFGYYTGSALALEALAWTDATTRATALTTQDGIYVKSGDATRRYLGTIRITSTTGQCADAGSAGPIKRFVWNMYNRVRSRNISYDSTASWTYASTTERIRNANSTAAKHEFVFGLADASLVVAESNNMGVAGSAQPWFTIGFNSTTSETGTKTGRGATSSTSNCTVFIKGCAILGTGYGYVAALESCSSANTTTFYGGSNFPFTTDMER